MGRKQGIVRMLKKFRWKLGNFDIGENRINLDKIEKERMNKIEENRIK